ncbi:hypothetical protein D5S18_13845 [Nocardia panacis]|uniref:Uncharacterized protein n=1 Tax=Nocardia panacis TaxID=2340916 RepID=A0A3A4KL14_9NOCA|nr:hypothetical protein D5S18_13845 [Nocardia panacis]
MVRLLAMLALLIGVIGMHAGVYAITSHGHHVTQRSNGHPMAGETDAPMGAHHGPAGEPTSAGAAARQPAAFDTAPASAAVRDHDSTQPTAVRQLDCEAGGCDIAHGAHHACVFVLSALELVIGLVLLGWLAVDRPETTSPLPRYWRIRRGRPPPWTVLSLSQLSILRI